ncbi:MAG: hypothetical protein H0W30_16050 [Gemmatimonadaceae bacterium]|nr:hypothetical protein [Gemmatimonadaceae bacterium]
MKIPLPDIKKLLNLKIQEVSLVDFPAHLTDGWMVLKSANGGNAPDSDPHAEAIRKAREELAAAERDAWKEIHDVLGTEAFKKYVLHPDADLDPISVAAALGGIIEEAEATEKARAATAATTLLPWRTTTTAGKAFGLFRPALGYRRIW